jgi:hypothetical protein
VKYAVKMGTSIMIYIPSVIKIGSGSQNLIWGDTYTHTKTQTLRDAGARTHAQTHTSS